MLRWLRKLRGALGNAVLWAGAWSLATIPTLGLLWLLGFGDLFGFAGLLNAAPRIALSLAMMGFVAGGSFSVYLGLSPGRRLGDLDLRVMGILGGVFGALMVPMFSWLPALLSFFGPPFPMAVGAMTAVASLTGAATAVGSVKLAQSTMLEPGSASGPALESEPDGQAEEIEMSSGSKLLGS